MVLTHQKPIQRKRIGELPEGLPGSTLERGMRGEQRQELGRPQGLLGTGRLTRQGELMVHGESDHPVVLGGRESRPHGEGGDGGTQPSQDTGAGHAGPEHTSQPPCGA